MNILDQIMGVDEASKLWGYSPGYIKNLCAEEKVEAKKIGKTWVISKNQNSPSMIKNSSREIIK
jgi:Helix-turn-helix domain